MKRGSAFWCEMPGEGEVAWGPTWCADGAWPPAPVNVRRLALRSDRVPCCAPGSRSMRCCLLQRRGGAGVDGLFLVLRTRVDRLLQGAVSGPRTPAPGEGCFPRLPLPWLRSSSGKATQPLEGNSRRAPPHPTPGHRPSQSSALLRGRREGRRGARLRGLGLRERSEEVPVPCLSNGSPAGHSSAPSSHRNDSCFQCQLRFL